MKFGYTILYVKNVNDTICFYEQAFGLTRKFIHDSGYGELITGETVLAFASLELAESNGLTFQAASLNMSAPGCEIGLVTDAPQAAYARAVAAGATEVKAPTAKPWGQIVAYVRDLNGFLVEICSPVS